MDTLAFSEKYWVLKAICEQGEFTVAEVAQETGLDEEVVQRVLDENPTFSMKVIDYLGPGNEEELSEALSGFLLVVHEVVLLKVLEDMEASTLVLPREATQVLRKTNYLER